MRKAGLDYQDLVALIESAFDSQAEVNVGEWIEGPDGRRELDVSIRGMRNGMPYFAFVECKDYRGKNGKRKVGVGAVDELDSKRHDLNADLVAIYSNSGYTAQALLKARRVGISTFTAIAMGDKRSRATPWTLAIGRLVQVVSLTEQVIEPPGQDTEIPQDLEMEEITFEDDPVHNWIVDLLAEVVSNEAHRREAIDQITIIVQFKSPLEFKMRGTSCLVAGLQILADLAVKWMGKPLPVTAELAKFDFQTGQLVVPPDTGMIVGFPSDHDQGWEPIEEPTADEAPPETLRLTIRARLQSQLVTATGGVPNLDPQVESMDVVLR